MSLTNYPIYLDHCRDIVSKKFASGNIYLYHESQINGLFDLAFKFCYNELQHHYKHYQPCGFFFRNASELNAMARRFPDGSNFIEINRGLIERLFIIYDSDQSRFDNLDEVETLKEIMGASRINRLMFELTWIFLFYHELGHIIQFTKRQESLQFSEKSYIGKGKFFPLNHLMELDADEFAINATMQIVMADFLAKPDELKTKNAIISLTVIAAVAIFILFYELSDKIRSEVTLNDGSHPHEVIRIHSIITVQMSFLEGEFGEKYEISAQEVFNRAMDVLASILPDQPPFLDICTEVMNNGSQFRHI